MSPTTFGKTRIATHMLRRTLLLSLGIAWAACGEAPVERPNIVLFVLDTVRADSLSVNGHPQALTPNIDRLAAQGVNFTAAYAHSTWTKPSIATLFTGAFPDRHRVRTPAEGVADRIVAQRLGSRLHTLAERFQEGGYATAAFVNQIHLQPKFGFDQGFEHYVWSTGKNAHQLNRRMLTWLPSASEPLFLYVHYLDPHWPYQERVEELLEALGSLGVDPRPPRDGNQVEAWLAAGLAPGSIEGLRARYDHGVAHTDRAVGYALENLGEAGLLDDAVVMVTSDHGEGFLEHGRLLHGYAPFDEVARVPLVVRLPERLGVEPTTVTQPVGLVDVMPTLLELAGLPPTEPGDRGRSLVPLMHGPGYPARAIYTETSGIRGLRSADTQLIRYPDDLSQCYDLASDPGAQRPLPCDDRYLELQEDLDLFIQLAASWRDRPEDTVELDETDIERLRALGYLND